MAAHFAGQQRAGFLHAGLDQRVAGTPHQRLAAPSLDLGGQVAGAFDVEDDPGARVALDNVAGEQHHQPVGIDQVAFVGDHAHAVTVAVEGQAQVSPGFLHLGDQVLQVFRLAGIGVVVGKGTVDIAV